MSQQLRLRGRSDHLLERNLQYAEEIVQHALQALVLCIFDLEALVRSMLIKD